jgi:uncharacterized membrane protein YfcA
MYKFKNEKAKQKFAKIAKLVTVGLIIGFVNGFFGGGGGMLLVPALGWVLKTSVKQSHATAIAVILPLSAVSALIYFLKDVELASNLFFSVTGGVLMGGALGAVLLKKLSPKGLSIIFYFVMIVAGLKMVFA